MAKKPELDETGGMKDRPSHPHNQPEGSNAPEPTETNPGGDFDEAKDGKANNKQQSGNRWWARWRS